MDTRSAHAVEESGDRGAPTLLYLVGRIDRVVRRHIHEAIRIHTEVTGARPLGFYQGKASVNTTSAISDERLPIFLSRLT